jgi:hypothetical protein
VKADASPGLVFVSVGKAAAIACLQGQCEFYPDRPGCAFFLSDGRFGGLVVFLIAWLLYVAIQHANLGWEWTRLVCGVPSLSQFQAEIR